MKRLTAFISEAFTSKTTIYFPTISSYLLYEWEVSGQISDGKWENSRPYDHWKWLKDVECVLDDNHEVGYEGRKHSINYNCNWMTQDLNRWLKSHNPDFAWTQRFLNYGKVGLIISETQAQRFGEEYAFRYIIGELPEEEITAEEFEASLQDYQLEYWNKVKNDLNEEFFKKFYSTPYTIRDLKADLADLQEAINNQLGWG